MVKTTILSLLIIIGVGMACAQKNVIEDKDLPIDKNATAETKALYSNLKKLAKTNILYGHQDDLAYGHDWWAEPGRSDVKEVTGSYPAVYGWELGDIRQGVEASLDSVNFESIKGWIKEAYSRGGINTISWHMNHPVTDGNTWDMTPAVYDIIPGGSQHEKFVSWLDIFADFITDLKDENGEAIPIIFRPYHEHTADWFWWGEKQTTVEEYVTLWRFTVDYLKDEKQLHNLLYAYSPDGGSKDRSDKYMEKYPGDDYVDILGYDEYGSFMDGKNDVEVLSNALAKIVTEADARNKIAALTETGQEKIPSEKWFTESLLKAMTLNPKASEISYVLTWRNANQQRENREHFYSSYPSHSSAPDMKKFKDAEIMFFEDDLPNMYTLNN
tara:strand:- start:14827 stop:15981 length:1155 start_codon:yes stop_codon:yes gene_type:complete